MLAQILYNKEGKPAVAAPSPFTDVKEGAWYANAVIWAAENDIVAGYGSGRGSGVLDPGGNAARAETATMLMQYCMFADKQ